MPKTSTCQNCASGALKRLSTTYPLTLPGRRLDVARVQVLQCADCGHLMPTSAGQAKLERALHAFGALLDNPQE
jgi:hypothetical protein